jgi:hypothetical protein
VTKGKREEVKERKGKISATHDARSIYIRDLGGFIFIVMNLPNLRRIDIYRAQRAVNAEDYLVTEQGIDASRISVVTGTSDRQTV